MGGPVSKKITLFGMIAGSIIGGMIPMLWNAGLMSMSGVVLSTLGGIVGVYLTYRITS